jgi:hypothetical protein
LRTQGFQALSFVELPFATKVTRPRAPHNLVELSPLHPLLQKVVWLFFYNFKSSPKIMTSKAIVETYFNVCVASCWKSFNLKWQRTHIYTSWNLENAFIEKCTQNPKNIYLCAIIYMFPLNKWFLNNKLKPKLWHIVET